MLYLKKTNYLKKKKQLKMKKVLFATALFAMISLTSCHSTTGDATTTTTDSTIVTMDTMSTSMDTAVVAGADTVKVDSTK